MENLRERLSYLQGMADGFGLTNQSKEGRMTLEIMHLMGDMVSSMERMNARIEEQDEYIEAIDEDMTDLEEYVAAIDEDLDDVEEVLFEDGLENIDFESMDEEQARDGIITVDETYDEMSYDDDDIGFFEVECPTCQELISIDQHIFDDDLIAEVLCPDCHEVILVNDDEMDEQEEMNQYVID